MNRTRSPLRLFQWGFASWLLLLVPLLRWGGTPAARMTFPETPITHVNGSLAHQWRFLLSARDAVLPGSSYTVRAANLDDEMSLFMFSLALCTRRSPMPTTYFGGPRPEGAKARFVLAYQDYTGGEPGLRFVVRFEDGAVYERPGAAH